MGDKKASIPRKRIDDAQDDLFVVEKR